jgi:hypothetical protein
MPRRPVKNKKLPSHYPTFAFRVSETVKKEIIDMIETIQVRANRRRLKDESFVNKNDVIVEALLDGLKRKLKAQKKDSA